MRVVSVTYLLSEDAFMAGCDQIWAHRAIGRKGNYFVAGLVAVLGLIMLWQGVPGWWGWALLAGAGVFIALDRSRDRIWRRYYRQAVKYSREITATLADTGVGVVSAEGENTLPWSHFRDYAITRDYIVLNIDQRLFSLIPRAAFASPADHAMAEQILVKNLKLLKSRLL